MPTLRPSSVSEMRVAALYDVHGNLPALEAVLAELAREGGADEIIVGGDVLWGPMQSECIELLRSVGATFVCRQLRAGRARARAATSIGGAPRSSRSTSGSSSHRGR